MGAILSFFKQVSRVYFREIEAVGNLPAEKTAGRLFAANHTNGLVDPILVLTQAPCPIAPVAKSTLWKIPVLRWLLDAVDAVPIVRRRDDPDKVATDDVFEKVGAHIARGGNVLIFPEGTSHNEPKLVPLRTGGARMLARAHAAGAKGLTFQAVGLEFDARDTFRSRAAVIYGPVRSVDELGLSGEPLVQAITDRIREDLSELIVEGDTWEERLLISRAAELFANEQGKRSLAGWNEIGRQVEAARRALTDEPLYRELADLVSRYYDALEIAGLRDADVLRDKAPPPRWRKRLLLAAALPLALPGAILYFVPYQIPRLVTRRMKEKDRDEVSTYKLATGLVVYPVWAGALITGSFLLLPPPLSWAASAGILASPLAALAWLDHLEHRPRRPPATSAELEDLRARVMRALNSAREKLAA